MAWIEEARTRDPEQERADWDQAVKAHTVTKNEVRARLGLPPRDDGDVYVAAGPAPNGLAAGRGRGRSRRPRPAPTAGRNGAA